MAAGRTGWGIAGAVVLAVMGALPAGAKEQEPGGIATSDGAYRCSSSRGVTYSQVPCPGGKLVRPGTTRTTDKWRPPPQDRAVAAKRARLSAEDRQECAALDRGMRQEERMLKAKEGATLDDEMPLVRMKKKFRELKC